MTGWLRRTATDLVARLNAIADQDADPAALVPSFRRSRRGQRRPAPHDLASKEPAEPAGAATAAHVEAAPPASSNPPRATETDRTESEAKDELARIMAAQQYRMRGGRRSDASG